MVFLIKLFVDWVILSMITYKTQEQLESIKEGGAILAKILDEVVVAVKPGVTTAYLDDLAGRLMRDAGGISSFRGYQPDGFKTPFPGVICASVNDEVVHGIPRQERILQEGDCIGVDIGMIYKGCYTDMARTVGVGKIDQESAALLQVTQDALMQAISVVKSGNTVQDIGRAVENFVKPFGYGIVRGLVGHGVGNAIWEEPQIPNYVVRGTARIKLRPGMVIAIEPMLNLGSEDVYTLPDGWTISTVDHSRSAHFEHTVIVTESGYEIATL